jgi:hypothetical protein
MDRLVKVPDSPGGGLARGQEREVPASGGPGGEVSNRQRAVPEREAASGPDGGRAGVRPPGTVEPVKFEVKVYCQACSVGHLVAIFHEQLEEEPAHLRLPISGEREVPMPGSECTGCHRPLIVEVEQVGEGPIEYLMRHDPVWATIYLAARRAGGSHADSAAAADAVTAAPAG